MHNEVRNEMVSTTLATAVLILWTGALRAAPSAATVTLWPGYTIELPAGHCVELSRRVDFDVIYIRDPSAPKTPVLVGVYAGHNPENLDCANATVRQSSANGLSVRSARAPDGCAEFLVQDVKTHERGFLHIWFGPAAKDHPERAENVVASVRQAPLPVYRPDNLPACK